MRGVPSRKSEFYKTNGDGSSQGSSVNRSGRIAAFEYGVSNGNGKPSTSGSDASRVYENKTTSETRIYANGHDHENERTKSMLELEFPTHAVEIVDDEDSSDEETVVDGPQATVKVVPTTNPNKGKVQGRVQGKVQDQLSMDDYLDLPNPSTVMFLFQCAGICFVTIALILVLYAATGASSEGGTLKVLCIMIILPIFYFLAMCGVNLYGMCFARKYALDDIA